jgi:hypothetical protein
LRGGRLYYEDGANLTSDGFINILEKEQWSREGWFVKYSKEQIDKEKLEMIHIDNKGRMLSYDESYENCIIK